MARKVNYLDLTGAYGNLADTRVVTVAFGSCSQCNTPIGINEGMGSIYIGGTTSKLIKSL